MAKTARSVSTRQATMTVEEARDRLRDVVDLTENIMSARRNPDKSEERFRAFRQLLEDDYREFARTENFPREADAVSQLTSVFERMRQIRLARHLAARNICAVAGGFSSGKSSLLNRLMGVDLLPTGITPTTSIPTYVSQYDEIDDVKIEVFNRNGGSLAVPPRTLQQMTHGFGTIDGRDVCIPWKHIVDRVSVLTPNLRRWSQVAFVDTPGYTNLDDTGDVLQDEQVAEREVLASRFLIWVVDIERGALPQQDIEFIGRFANATGSNGNPERRQRPAPIYIVLNKADKKASDRKSILRSVAATVEKHDLRCSGVGLYSVNDDQWYDHDGCTFKDWLDRINGEAIRVDLDSDVKSVFEDYLKFHGEEVKRLQYSDGLLKRLDIQVGDAMGSRIKEDLVRYGHDIKSEFDKHRSAVDESRNMQRRFLQCAQDFMESVGLQVSRSERGEQRDQDSENSSEPLHETEQTRFPNSRKAATN